MNDNKRDGSRSVSSDDSSLYGLTGDRDTDIVRNMPLVGMVIKQLFSQYRERHGDDMFSEGTIGLIKAVDKFDSSRAKFSTFATRCIGREIYRYLKSRCDTIRIPEYIAREERSALRKALAPRLITDLDTNNLGDAFRETGFDAQPDFDPAGLDNDLARKVWEAANTLPPPLAEVLKMRYKDGATLLAIARRLSRSRETASQMCKKAVRLVQIAMKVKVSDGTSRPRPDANQDTPGSR